LPAPHDTGPLFTHYIIRKMQGERAGRPKREKCNDESVGHRWNYGDVELQHGIILEKRPRKLPPGRSAVYKRILRAVRDKAQSFQAERPQL